MPNAASSHRSVTLLRDGVGAEEAAHHHVGGHDRLRQIEHLDHELRGEEPDDAHSDDAHEQRREHRIDDLRRALEDLRTWLQPVQQERSEDDGRSAAAWNAHRHERNQRPAHRRGGRGLGRDDALRNARAQLVLPPAVLPFRAVGNERCDRGAGAGDDPDDDADERSAEKRHLGGERLPQAGQARLHLGDAFDRARRRNPFPSAGRLHPGRTRRPSPPGS